MHRSASFREIRYSERGPEKGRWREHCSNLMSRFTFKILWAVKNSEGSAAGELTKEKKNFIRQKMHSEFPG